MQQMFDGKIHAWVQYNASAGGRLRHAIMFHHLQAQLPRRAVHVLDVGGGSGEMASDLARLGNSVTLLDFSPAMIKQAGCHCAALNVTMVCADVSQLEALFQPASFDLVVCHSLLEFLDQPAALLGALARFIQFIAKRE